MKMTTMPSPARWAGFVFLAAVMVAVALAGSQPAYAQQPAAPAGAAAPAPAATGDICLSVTVTGAALTAAALVVLIDGTAAAQAAATIACPASGLLFSGLSAGNHMVAVAAPDHTGVAKEVTVVAGNVTAHAVTLTDPCAAEVGALAAKQGEAQAADGALGGPSNAAAAPPVAATGEYVAYEAALAADAAAKAALASPPADSDTTAAQAEAEKALGDLQKAKVSLAAKLAAVSAAQAAVAEADKGLAVCRGVNSLAKAEARVEAEAEARVEAEAEAQAEADMVRDAADRARKLGMVRITAASVPASPEKLPGFRAWYYSPARVDDTSTLNVNEARDRMWVLGRVTEANVGGLDIRPDTNSRTGEPLAAPLPEPVYVEYNDLRPEDELYVVEGSGEAPSGVAPSVRGGYSLSTSGGAGRILREEVVLEVAETEHASVYVMAGAAQRWSRAPKATSGEYNSYATGGAGIRFGQKPEPGDSVNLHVDVEGRAYVVGGAGGGGAVCPGVDVAWDHDGHFTTGGRVCAEAAGFNNGGGSAFGREVEGGTFHGGVGVDLDLFRYRVTW